MRHGCAGAGHLCSVVAEDVGPVHEAEVGPSVEHVEIDWAVGRENVACEYSLSRSGAWVGSGIGAGENIGVGAGVGLILGEWAWLGAGVKADVTQDLPEVRLRKCVMIFLKPMVEPA